MILRPDEVPVYSWGDGWCFVRPTTLEAYDRLFGRLVTEGRYRFDAAIEASDRHRNARGRAGTVFLMRPLSQPAGLMTTHHAADRLNRVVLAVFFSSEDAAGRERSDGRFIPHMRPGRYKPLVLEGLSRAYSLLLVLDESVHGFLLDRNEHLLLPSFGSESGRRYLETFVRDIAASAWGSTVASSSFDAGGWSHPQVTGDSSTKAFFSSSRSVFLASEYRFEHRQGPPSFEVSVPLPRSCWDVVGDEARDVRPWLDPKARDFVDRARSRPIPVPAEAEPVPWTVRGPWGDEVSSISLTEALVGAGVVARTLEEVRSFAQRKAAPDGVPYEGSQLQLSLGVMPDLFTCPLSQVRELAQLYGVAS